MSEPSTEVRSDTSVSPEALLEQDGGFRTSTDSTFERIKTAHPEGLVVDDGRWVTLRLTVNEPADHKYTGSDSLMVSDPIPDGKPGRRVYEMSRGRFGIPRDDIGDRRIGPYEYAIWDENEAGGRDFVAPGTGVHSFNVGRDDNIAVDTYTTSKYATGVAKKVIDRINTAVASNLSTAA
jgi:hypothetical protein